MVDEELEHLADVLERQQALIDELRAENAILRVEVKVLRDIAGDTKALRTSVLEHGCKVDRLLSLMSKGVWS